jgi:hypothetical protein
MTFETTARLFIIPGAAHISCVEQPAIVPTQNHAILAEVKIG